MEEISMDHFSRFEKYLLMIGYKVSKYKRPNLMQLLIYSLQQMNRFKHFKYIKLEGPSNVPLVSQLLCFHW